MVPIRLTHNRYGKAEVHLLRVGRRGDVHEIRDLTVGVALTGDYEHVYRDGDNAGVLPTDSQKNTVHAFAAEAVPGEIEDFGLRLARHFVATSPAVRRAEVRIEERAWTRIDGHPHAFASAAAERRQAMLVADETGAWAAAGLTDLLVLKSAGSEFRGFERDRYTTLQEAGDRILATTVTARWRYAHLDVDWAACFATARHTLLETFATRPSRSLQHTLDMMGRAVLEACPDAAEIRLRLPNRHHFAVDVAQFGTRAEGQVFDVADRPYGLIEGTLGREDAPAGPPLDW
ncbi:MAG TPA: urate oxidase [Candidatus Dormibacteraeota bacterium]|nr:urate oxidase [Candidatus Dormibacteraeota bacterium]